MTCCEKVFFDDLEYNWTYRGVAKILSSKLQAKPSRRLICVCRAESVRKAYCLDSSLKKSSRPWRISWVCWDEIATTRILNSKRCFSIDEISLTVAPRAIYLTAKLTGHKDTMLKLEQPSSRLLYKWNVRWTPYTEVKFAATLKNVHGFAAKPKQLKAIECFLQEVDVIIMSIRRSIKRAGYSILRLH